MAKFFKIGHEMDYYSEKYLEKSQKDVWLFLIFEIKQRNTSKKLDLSDFFVFLK